jgi:glycosyltransferase involved in cell wall biosynthesis
MSVTSRENVDVIAVSGHQHGKRTPTGRRSLRTVDVVIPCYNYGRYLKTSVNSVLSQVGVEVRVLVIDDASSDDSVAIAGKLASAESRVTFRKHVVNKGHIATYNEGLIDWSEADHTVLLSADDMLAPGSLSRAVAIMDADERIGMVYGQAIHFKDEAEPPVQEMRLQFSHRRWSGADWLEERCRAAHNVITSPEVVVRRRVQQRVGGYRPELPHAGDLEMWLRIAAVSDIAYVRQTQAYYRVHASSMMRTVYRGSFFDLQQRKLVFDKFYQNHRGILADADRLYELANRALAREALWDACRAYDRDEVEASHAAEIVEFAMTTYSAAATLPEYSALRRRRALGPLICNRTQVFAIPALVRKAHRWALKERWKRQGV